MSIAIMLMKMRWLLISGGLEKKSSLIHLILFTLKMYEAWDMCGKRGAKDNELKEQDFLFVQNCAVHYIQHICSGDYRVT